MRHFFTFANVMSKDHGVYISGENLWASPERSYDIAPVPGRNGDLVLDNGRYENIKVTYPCFIREGADVLLPLFRNLIFGKRGYQRLEDTYHPDEYRYGYCAGSFDPSMGAGNYSAKFDVSFNCKPQRFLKVGDIPVILTSSGKIYNPTAQIATPKIRVYGNGTLVVGGVEMAISNNADNFIDIDSDIMDCHRNGENMNAFVMFSNDKFPMLDPDATNFELSGVDRVEVTPKWWMI